MTRQKQFQTAILLSVFFLLGGYANAQKYTEKIWPVPLSKYGNGQTRYETLDKVTLKNGKKVVQSTHIGTRNYYETGQIKREVLLNDNNKFIEKHFYPDGQLAKIGEADSYIGSTILDGQWKSYHPNGQLWQIVNFGSHYDDVGDYREYYSTGVLKATGKVWHFKSPCETWTLYNENGELERTEQFRKENGYAFKSENEGVYLFLTKGVDDEMKVFDLLKRFKN